MSQSIALALSFVSGGLAALASVFAKLLTSSATLRLYHQSCVRMIAFISVFNDLPILKAAAHSTTSYFCPSDSDKMSPPLLRIASGILVVVANVLMWASFTKALALSKSSIHVTVVNTISNLLLTAILGDVIFGEKLTRQFWVGATLILAGTILMNRKSWARSEEIMEPARQNKGKIE
ncbi:hypothetical protein BKA69DRAFT_1164595 [Paraphysoderma sedebokerense]|nr:hypothetical protein BKA69DRAFT_1164595 [Paraphysoderma sedebokerense]